MIVLLNITLIIMYMYFIYKIKHSFHMFQLESYKNERYKTWMSKNRTQAIKFRDLLLIIPIIIIPFNILAGMITQIIIVGLLYISRDFYEEKKPLVYTPRIKRLYTTTILIYVIIAILCNLSIVISNNIVYQTLAITLINLLIIGTMYLVYVVNFINSPIENMISRKFYKMSQKKLEDMPNLKIIGITGSYGKTSTKYALTTLLKQKYNVCMTPENFNTLSGVERAINENLKSTDQIFVCEMGAKNIGDIQEICDLVHPTYGVLTAIGPQHLETFKTIENVRKTKMELIDSLPKEGKAFINYEDENIKATKVEKNNIKYGLNNTSDVYAYNIEMTESGATFNIHTPNGEIEDIKTKLLGEHNILNIVGAISVCIEMGLTIDEIKAGMRYIKPVPHRLELKKNPNGLLIIDDAYNSNIQGATKAFETLKMFKNKTRILVTPGMVDFGTESEKYNTEFGKRAANCADFVILVGKKQAEPIKKGLVEEKYPEDKIYVAENLQDAIKKWNEFDASNSVILLENDLPDNYL